MKVIAFHTGGRYEEEAELLGASLDRLCIDYHIAKIEGFKGDWDRAVALKPVFIAECRNAFKGPLVSVDVDCFFHEDPSDYFDSLKCDFSAHWFQGPSGGYDRERNDNWLLSGTMYWGDTLRARKLLRAWIHENNRKQALGDWKGGGQANLYDVLKMNKIDGLRVLRLPGRYCYVFDKPWAYPKGCVPVIEHLIASRENRGASKGKVCAKRSKRIEELWRLVNEA